MGKFSLITYNIDTERAKIDRFRDRDDLDFWIEHLGNYYNIIKVNQVYGNLYVALVKKEK